MNNFFKHITSLFLALLVLVSTQSYSINFHYCGSILVDKSFVKPAKKCAMHVLETTSCNMHQEEGQSQQNQDKSCCEDEFEMIEGQDEIKLQETSIKFPTPFFLFALAPVFYANAFTKKVDHCFEYKSPPPLFQRDVFAFFQVYLI